jgi:predicted permease
VLLVPATLFAIMFALGLGLPEEIRELISRRRALLLQVLFGSCVLVPLVVVLLLQLPLSELLSQPARFGLALMAVCPSAPLTLRKVVKARRQQRSGGHPAGQCGSGGHRVHPADGPVAHHAARC